MREHYEGPIVIEVRHKSWSAEPARNLLDHYRLDPVLADPAPVWKPEDLEHAAYVRLHGSPQMYYSRYDIVEVARYAGLLAPDGWCVFDNTASGAALANALEMKDLIEITAG
jgi:uncharacterized protein YecE (DUF72 family)